MGWENEWHWKFYLCGEIVRTWPYLKSEEIQLRLFLLKMEGADVDVDGCKDNLLSWNLQLAMEQRLCFHSWSKRKKISGFSTSPFLIDQDLSPTREKGREYSHVIATLTYLLRFFEEGGRRQEAASESLSVRQQLFTSKVKNVVHSEKSKAEGQGDENPDAVGIPKHAIDQS